MSGALFEFSSVKLSLRPLFPTSLAGMRTTARVARAIASAGRGAAARPKASIKVAINAPNVARGQGFADTWSPVEGSETAPPDNALRRYFDGNTSGPGIWKWDHYFEVYDRHLHRFVDTPAHLLEVGIYSGGSLPMWLDYLGAQATVHGVDIEPACRAYEGDRVTVDIGDQADRSFWADFRRRHPIIDVVIDDGGHAPEQQMVTVEEMLPFLRPGGVYICEDVHGLDNAFTAFVHGLVDRLNASRLVDLDDARMPTSGFQQAVHSVHAYPFVIVIERHIFPPAKLRAPRRGTEWQPFYERSATPSD